MANDSNLLLEYIRSLRWFISCSHTGLSAGAENYLAKLTTAISVFLAQYDAHSKVVNSLERERAHLMQTGAELEALTVNAAHEFVSKITSEPGQQPILLTDDVPAVQHRMISDKMAVHFATPAGPVEPTSQRDYLTLTDFVCAESENLTIEQRIVNFLKQRPNSSATDHELVHGVVKDGNAKKRARRTSQKIQRKSVRARISEMLAEKKLVMSLERGRIVYKLCELVTS